MAAAPFWPQTLVDYAQIISAIGTLAAVIVSLYLATRRPSPELSATIGMRIVIATHTKATPDILYIGAANIGMPDVVINNLGWEVRRAWPKRLRLNAIQMAGNDPRAGQVNPALPVRLSHGADVTFTLSCSEPDGWIQQIERRGFFAPQLRKRSDFDRVRFVFYTTVGKPFRVTPEAGLLDRMWVAQQKFLGQLGVGHQTTELNAD